MEYYLYVLQCKRSKDVKIGIAGDLKTRIRAYPTYRPSIEVLAAYKLHSKDAAMKAEAQLMKDFKSYSIGGEWFNGDRIGPLMLQYINLEIPCLKLSTDGLLPNKFDPMKGLRGYILPDALREAIEEMKPPQ